MSPEQCGQLALEEGDFLLWPPSGGNKFHTVKKLAPPHGVPPLAKASRASTNYERLDRKRQGEMTLLHAKGKKNLFQAL